MATGDFPPPTTKMLMYPVHGNWDGHIFPVLNFTSLCTSIAITINEGDLSLILFSKWKKDGLCSTI